MVLKISLCPCTLDENSLSIAADPLSGPFLRGLVDVTGITSAVLTLPHAQIEDDDMVNTFQRLIYVGGY